MTKKELETLLKSDNFSKGKPLCDGPYQITGYHYKNRSDIYIEEMSGNYNLIIDPMHGEVDYKEIELPLKCYNLYAKYPHGYAVSEKEAKENTLSVEGVYRAIDKYIDELEQGCIAIRDLMNQKLNGEFNKLRPNV